MRFAAAIPAALAGLAVCAAVTSSQHSFSIKVFTSTDDQFGVNSVIIEGEHEAGEYERIYRC
jgi:hypothetical protein